MNRNKILSYNSKLKVRARGLRKAGILSEVLLWHEIKGKKIKGYEFHRQVPIDSFIVDFYCHELMLAIEIDGSSHNDRIERDHQRQEHLEGLGVHFLRFYDGDVKKNLYYVVTTIENWIMEFEKKGKHPPAPFEGGTS